MQAPIPYIILSFKMYIILLQCSDGMQRDSISRCGLEYKTQITPFLVGSEVLEGLTLAAANTAMNLHIPETFYCAEHGCDPSTFDWG